MAGPHNGSILDRYELTNDIFFQWAQLKHTIPTRWKNLIFNYTGTNENDLYQNHHVIKGARILFVNKLSSKEMYAVLILNTVNKPTSNIYFEKSFENTTLDWSKIYLLSRLATIDTILGSLSWHYQLSWVLFNIKFLITYFFSIKNYTLLD